MWYKCPVAGCRYETQLINKLIRHLPGKHPDWHEKALTRQVDPADLSYLYRVEQDLADDEEE